MTDPDTGAILVAGVGNVLRCDDGFGPAVADRLRDGAAVPAGVEVVETGIGGMSLLQELMGRRWDALLIIDAVDRGEAPGTLFVIEPEIEAPHHVPDTHLANPDRVLMMAGALGVLPERVLLLGCQPQDTESHGEPLTAPVQRAVDAAVPRVVDIVREWLREGSAGA